MKKQNLSLKALKVNSFVTSMEANSAETVKGGYTTGTTWTISTITQISMRHTDIGCCPDAK